tara:strand:+ start:1126 stop:1845 length:720 start_codon:yes stop_codon:yes gene_type:complete
MLNAPGRQVNPKFGGGSFWDKVLLQNAAAPDLGQYLGTPSEEDTYGDGTIVKPKGIQTNVPIMERSSSGSGDVFSPTPDRLSPLPVPPVGPQSPGGTGSAMPMALEAGLYPPNNAIGPQPSPLDARRNMTAPPPPPPAAAVPPAGPPSAGIRTAEAIAKLTGRDTDTSGTSEAQVPPTRVQRDGSILFGPNMSREEMDELTRFSEERTSPLLQAIMDWFPYRGQQHPAYMKRRMLRSGR